MIPAKEIDDARFAHDLPLELRRAWTVHRTEASSPDLMLSGIVGEKERDELISPYLLRQNLVVPAYPFRTACPALHEAC
jgi:hypothetical protein